MKRFALTICCFFLAFTLGISLTYILSTTRSKKVFVANRNPSEKSEPEISEAEQYDKDLGVPKEVRKQIYEEYKPPREVVWKAVYKRFPKERIEDRIPDDRKSQRRRRLADSLLLGLKKKLAAKYNVPVEKIEFIHWVEWSEESQNNWKLLLKPPPRDRGWIVPRYTPL